LTAPGLGCPAPDFSARNQHGETRTLSQLRGSPAVLVFFPFAFTGICTSELAGIQQHLSEFSDAGARVLAISTDTMFSLRIFAEQEGFGFDLLSDHWPHGAIASAYGAFDPVLGCALRGSFVLDAEGRVIWTVLNQIGDARDITAHLSALRA
jgi:peroxiredoxin